MVHTLILEDGTKINMLAERKYPLTKETLERMLSLRLVAGTTSKDAYPLLRFIQKQIDEYGSHDGALAIPEQTATGKEISKPFNGFDGRIVGFQKFLQLSAATCTSYYCQFYLVLPMKNAKFRDLGGGCETRGGGDGFEGLDGQLFIVDT
ncbi:hypothetical protein Tco_1276929 [Tanacetum coccineum]